MDRRRLKQLIYGGVYLAIFLFFASSIYFFFVKPAPSCFDKKQNQNEEGVDCGGVCAQFCLPANLQQVSVIGDVKVFSPAKDKVSLLGRIKNPNTTHGALVSYTLTVYDQLGQVLGSTNQTATLFPGQVRYVAVPSLDLPGVPDEGAKADLRFQKIDWQPAELLRPPQVVIRDQTVKSLGNFVEVSGTASNNDIVDVPRATILAIFFNQFRNPVGVAETELTSLSSGESRGFTIIYPILPSLTAERTQVFILTN